MHKSYIFSIDVMDFHILDLHKIETLNVILQSNLNDKLYIWFYMDGQNGQNNGQTDQFNISS